MSSFYCQEPIAIVGLACRLPGEIKSPSELWQFLKEERSAQSDTPKNRVNLDAWYHPDGSQRPGSINCKGGFYLSQDDSFRQFDPSFFGISPLEAATMDPQQRKLLEVVYESFESAGVSLKDVSGSTTGCFVGNFTFDHGQLQARDIEFWSPYQMTGGSLTILSNRVNYVFNMKGPSVTLDTACSSTMYALHLACQSLQAGDCSAAVVGGTNLIFGVEQTLGSVRLGILSPTSVSHTYDESADGYARGEAVGSIYIKRLSDALKAGDPIRAVIRGTSINANGKGPGISHPSESDQEAVIRKAYSNAGLDFEDTAYFEAHGTGTSVGDPIEFSAIGNVFAQCHSAEDPLLVGAVKTNLGHGEAASAISSVIKTVACLENSSIPATIGIKNFNPKLDFREGALKIVQGLTPWPQSHVHYRRASVNSFGFGGANAHLILDATDSYLGRQLTNFKRLSYTHQLNGADTPSLGSHSRSDSGISTGSDALLKVTAGTKTAYLLAFSSHNEPTLERNIEALLDASESRVSLQDLAYTLNKTKTAQASRAFAVVTDSAHALQESDEPPSISTDQVAEVKASLKFGNADEGSPSQGAAFVFTGQGAQWPRMGMELLAEYPSVRQTIIDMDEVLASLPPSLAPRWRILETLDEPAASSKIMDAERSQTVCTALQIAIFDLLCSWGIRPSATVGHSSGEIAAAYASGYLTLRQAILVAYFRGFSVSRNNKKGMMLAAGIGAEKISSIIEGVPDVCIACHNSAASVTLSGTEEAINQVQSVLSDAGVFNRKLATSGNAYHSWLMKEAGVDYEKHLLTIPTFSGDSLPSRSHTHSTMFSSVSGKQQQAGQLPLEYWRTNLESQVLFDQAVETMIQQMPEVRYLIEVGPHSALSGPIKDILTALDDQGQHVYHPTLRRNADGVQNILTLAGNLFLAGYPLDLDTVNSEEVVHHPHEGTQQRPAARIGHRQTGRFVVDLPPYQWVYDSNGDQHWPESRLSREIRFRQYPRHDLLGSRIAGSSKSSPSWRNIIHLNDLPWLRDHKAGGNIVFPAAGYISLALIAATQAAGLPMSMCSGPDQPISFKVQPFNIGSAMVLQEDSGTEVITDLHSIDAAQTKFDFTISSVSSGNWTTHASGGVRVSIMASTLRVPTDAFNTPGHRHGVNEKTQDKRWYETWQAVGMDYGAMFRPCSNIRSTWAEDEALANVELRITRPSMPYESWYPSHPTAIDACFQLAMVAVHGGDPVKMTKAYLPVDSEGMTFFTSPESSSSETGMIRAQGAFTGLRSNQATMEMVTDTGLVLFQGQMSTMSMEGGQGLSSSNTPDRLNPYARLVWKPDIDHLSTKKVESLFERSKAPGNTEAEQEAYLKDTVSKTEELAALATLDSVHRLPESLDLGTLPDHMVLFVRSIQNYAQTLSPGELGRLSATEREERIESLAAELRDVPEASLVAVLNRHMPEIVSGRMGALDTMLQDNLLSRLYEEGLSQLIAHVKLKKVVDLMAHKNPKLNILEIGSGTGGATRPILDALNGKSTDPGVPPCYQKLTFTDVSTAFLSAAQENFKEYHNLEFKLLDIEKDPLSQEFEEETYDLIFAANVIHATRMITESLRHCRKLLKPGGRIMLIETTRNRLLTNFILGTLPGFWLGVDDGRPDGPFISPKDWSTRYAAAGFSTDLIIDDIPEPDTFTAIVIGRKVGSEVDDNGGENLTRDNSLSGSLSSSNAQVEKDPVWLIYRDKPHRLVAEVEKLYSEQCVPTNRCSLVDFPGLASGIQNGRTIMLAELESPLLSQLSEAEMCAVKEYTSIATTAVWVTNAGVLSAHEPQKMLGFGLGPSVRIEQPRFQVARIDVDPDASGEAASREALRSAARLIVDTETEFRRSPVSDLDTELVQQDGVVYVARYQPDPEANELFNRSWKPSAKAGPVRSGMSLHFGQIGRLDTFYFQPDPEAIDGTVEDSEVLVENRAFALDHRMVALAKGQKSLPFLNVVAAGVVLRTGANVQGIQEGDNIVYLRPNKFNTVLRVRENFCCRVPSTGVSEDAVGQLLPFTVAVHTLRNVCRLRPRHRVLIDMGADSLGFALIQVALVLGCHVVAAFTSQAERQALERLQNASLSVIDTEELLGYRPSSKFRVVISSGPMTSTGADSLPNISERGAQIVLFPSRRGVPDVKWDAMSTTLIPQGFGVSYVDPLNVGLWDEEDVCMALKEASDLIWDRSMVPIPSQTFDLSQFTTAADLVEQDVGANAVLTYNSATTIAPINDVPEPLTFSSDAFYIMIGCLGGLGRTLTMWMIARGARNFIFLSRSAADKPEAAELVRELDDMSKHKHRLNIHVVRGDVSDREDVQRAISYAEGAPIKGVVQAAMVLKDMLFADMTLDVWNAVVHPKCLGTIHLHELLQDHDLDFFCMTSSALGTLGAAMQSNYAAANAFLDAMARHRRSRGQQATSIALGMIVDAGHVEEHPDVEKALVRNGLYRITLGEYLLNMEAAMRRCPDPSRAPGGPRGPGGPASSSPALNLFAYDPLAAGHFINGLDPARMPGKNAMGSKNLWPNDNRLRHVLHARDVAQEGAEGGGHRGGEQAGSGAGAGQSVAARLGAAAAEGGDGAVAALVQQLVMERFSRLVLVPLERMSPARALSHYGMDSMISAELRNWIWHEFETDVPFMSLMDQGLTFQSLCSLVVKAMG